MSSHQPPNQSPDQSVGNISDQIKRKKIRIADLKKYKEAQKKITCLTAYDYRTSQIMDEMGIDLILIGDSVTNVYAGEKDTQTANLDQIIYHLKAVKKGCQYAIIVGDMPFGSYQIDLSSAMQSAIALIKAGAEAIKLEGATDYHLSLIRHMTDNGIPVIGHIGYTPQSSHLIGHGRIQGRSDEEASLLRTQALHLQDAGAVAIVLELMPADLARDITEAISIPTIGIGAGSDCDGQILVIDDMLGRFDWTPSFVRRYAEIGQIMRDAIQSYITDVREGDFPCQ